MGLALVLNIVIELLARKDMMSLLGHIASFPLFFLFSWALITLTLSLSLFFRHKPFLLLVVSSLWLGLGGLNAYVLSYRVSPLSAIDFFILQISWDFIGVYMSIVQLVLLVAAIVLVVAGLTWIYRKAPQSPVKLKSAIMQASALLLLTVALGLLPKFLNMAEEHLSDMRTACDKYGFVYCFFRGAVERGIEEPENYSKETVDEEVETLKVEGDLVPKSKPNVIMLQLESFFDVNLLNDLDFSENPLPFFTYLKENFSKGRLSVPTVGAGTANTEFEILTQMNLEFFGSGEYPYKTVLKTETCETAPYNYRKLGYETFVVHNNNATFYDRNEIFPRLGIGTFISSEYMVSPQRNPEGWIKDRCLIPEIFKCLSSTQGPDYLYTISVQGHGAYPSEKLENPPIKVTKSPKEEELTNQIEYYVNQLKEMDDFLRELTVQLQALDEPTVLVLYGDHMPSLNLEEPDLLFGNLFETEYVLWANYGLARQVKDLQAYQLSAYVMERLNMNTGLLTKLHQNAASTPDYQEKLKTLSYDMLYGQKVSTGGKSYQPVKMKMGVDEISIIGVNSGGRTIVRGKNFTEQSHVAVNGARQETTPVSRRTLTVESLSLQKGDVVTVEQVSDDGVLLSSSEPFVYDGIR